MGAFGSCPGVLVRYPWYGNITLPLLLRACVTRLRSYRVMRALFSQTEGGGGEWLQYLAPPSFGTGTAYGTAETGKTSPKQDSGSSPPLCKSVSSKHLLSQSHSDGAQSNHFRCYHPVGVRTGLILKHMTNEHVSGWSICYLMGLIWNDGRGAETQEHSSWAMDWVFVAFCLCGLLVGREGFHCLLSQAEYLPLWEHLIARFLGRSVTFCSLENTNKVVLEWFFVGSAWGHSSEHHLSFVLMSCRR